MSTIDVLNNAVSSTATLQHSDRQNPACATELMATWSLVQAGFLLLSAFYEYDRTLTVFEGTATIDPPTIDPPTIDPPCNYTGVNCRESRAKYDN